MKYTTTNCQFETFPNGNVSINELSFPLRELEEFLDHYRTEMNIQSLEGRIISFLSLEDKETYKIWLKEQFEKSPKYTGPTGGGIDYIVSPTSMGPVITIRNNITKEEIDFFS